MNNVRPLLGGALGADMPEDVNQDQAIAKIILSAFTNAPAEHYEAISKAMSQRIEVDRNGQKRFLINNEEWAFDGLEGMHAIIVDVRAFAINFIGWWDVLVSELPQLLTMGDLVKKK